MKENETAYNSMKFSAVINIVLGVVMIVTGVTTGVLLFVSAKKLLSGKSGILF